MKATASNGMSSKSGTGSFDIPPQSGRTARVLRRSALIVALTLTGAISVHAQSVDENDLLLLDITSDRLRLATSVTGYAYQDSAVLSLAELAAALEFPISVDSETGRASGWFINPERTFLLDLNARTVTIDGRTSPFPSDEVFRHEFSILVSLDTLSNWFPVDLQLNMQSLSVEVAPREPLPFQSRADRRRMAGMSQGVGAASQPPLDNPYRLVGPQVADVGLGYSIRRPADGGKAQTGLTYSSVIAGDLGFMDSQIYLSGNDNDPLSNFRAKLSRDNLDMPGGLRYVEVGDITPPSAGATGGSTSYERGILIQGGGSVTGRDDLITDDLIRIDGDALEGWDVELFQNGMRIGFQTVGANGRYDFQNIEPISGENQFELVFYGPAGEQRTETVTRYSGLTPDQPGSVRYEFSVSQKGEPLHDPLDSEINDTISDRGSARIAAGVNVRVLPRLSLRSAWNSVMVDGERLNFFTFGGTTSVGSATLSVNATRDPLGGTRWDASAQLPTSMNLWGFDTRFQHTQFATYVPEEELTDPNDETLNLNSRTGVIVTGPIGSVRTRFEAFHNRAPEYRSNSLVAGFTSRYQNVDFGNTLGYESYDYDNETLIDREDARVYGSAFFSTRADPLTVRGGASYTLRPDAQVNRYFLDANLRVARDMTMNFRVSRDPISRRTQYTSGLNWLLPQVTLSPRLSYDSKGDYSGFIYASFSIAPKPGGSGVAFSNRSLANQGAAFARVFKDNDASGTFTKGDEPLSGVTVSAPQALRHVDTDSNGMAHLTGLSSARRTDVIVDQETLPDPALMPTHSGNSIQPRPATAPVIDFPVVLTGEIEGRVSIQRNAGVVPMPGVMVELVKASGEVQAFTASAHDGFYFFEGVPYGSYTVRLGGEQQARARAQSVSVGAASTLLKGVDFRLSENATPAQPVALPPLPAAAPPVPTPAPAPAVAALVRRPPPPEASPNVQTPAAAPSFVPGRDGRLAQLGAFGSASNARLALEAAISGGLVQREDVQVVAASTTSGVLHRVVVTPKGDSAASLCQTIKARGAACVTIDPAVL